METLLEKAKKARKKISPRTKINDEMVELLKAWLNGEIEAYQVSEALGIRQGGGMHLYKLAVILRDAIAQGKIKIN